MLHDSELLGPGHGTPLRPRIGPPVSGISPANHAPKLVVLDAADALQDLLSPPGNRLAKLRGDRAGQHSIRVNDQSRIWFRWRDGDAHDVEIVDYH